jgi:hypothetical protein
VRSGVGLWAGPARLTKVVFTYKLVFAMRDVIFLDRVEQAEILLKPQRIEVLRQLAEPKSCTEVAQVAERRVRGIQEGVYQAGARSYWFSPDVVGRIGLRERQDELSLGYLLDLMEQVQADVAALDRNRPELPSIAVSGEIRVPPERRAEFIADLRNALQDLFTRYGGAEGDAFKLAVACYPNPNGEPDEDASPGGRAD